MVCDPAPLPDADIQEELEGNPDEQAAVAATLSEVWGQLGFEDFRDGVHVLDLNLTTLDDCLEALRRRAERYRRFDD